MTENSPVIEKSLGTGFLPILLGNIALEVVAPEITTFVGDLLEYMAVEGYVLVRNGGTQVIKGAKNGAK